MSTDGRDLLYQMLRIRRFEEKCVELYSAEKIRGFLHLYIGEEAVAVGSISCLAPDDAIVATYREHGQALVRGVSPGAIMAEMYGKLEGCARGRGGSMHFFDAQKRLYGGNAIVGGGLPLAVGLALADKMQNRQRVTCCVFGDGAVAEGEFHESMNLASLWKLPVLFLCENNLYAMGTALQFEHSVDRAGEESRRIQRRRCIGRRNGRVGGRSRNAKSAGSHSFRRWPILSRMPHIPFPCAFDVRCRTLSIKSEVEEWKKRDPIATLSARLKSEGAITDADIEEMEHKVADEVAEAVNFAEAGAWEPFEDLTRFVYSERRPS